MLQTFYVNLTFYKSNLEIIYESYKTMIIKLKINLILNITDKKKIEIFHFDKK
jgi:hypothetical protein